ncbi:MULTISPECIES: hypothetical protein [unclassified Streptomyces]|uniref:hypothetical protein n=1 Tax=unclassified Streptomyces TaxID=2593676 RepID=UPI00081BB24F|nr:hypothetical protein [Streptomyces sp. BvitLS-983]MYX88455.1 hypothetical protein [Streptomyces sp. SID4915]SCE16922.1 hypothetical protein GA0115250_144786 [Streptomyces sp. BvitLS-983]
MSKTYFWVATLHTNTPHGPRITSDKGLVTPGLTTGQTRAELYTTVLNAVCERHGLSIADSAVTFWSLEPNDV